jgi:hypothetical protein
MNITVRPICGVAIGFELVNAADIVDDVEDKTYLALDLLIVRAVISLN